jgi:hypothetical protein
MSNYGRSGLAHALIAVTLCAWLGVQIEPAQPKKCANVVERSAPTLSRQGMTTFFNAKTVAL